MIKDFIYNDEVSRIIHQINSNFLDFNILEITGMGSQEIKHSNVLAWLFDDKEHTLGYELFIEFLKKICKENDFDKDDLLNYIYIEKKQDLKIYREKNNIDLIIEDTFSNKVFIIENKVWADERTVGDDGGQLQKYEEYAEKNYSDFKQHFIYLTPDLASASRKNWLSASYQMVTDSLENILKEKELLSNTKLVIESYIDLLKRNNIVSNSEIQELSKRIWDKPEYAKALEIIYNNRPNKRQEIEDIIELFASNNGCKYEEKQNSENYNYIIKVKDFPICLRLGYSTKRRNLVGVIVSKSDPDTCAFNAITINSFEFKKNDKNKEVKKQFEYNILSNWQTILSEDDISTESVKTILEDFKKSIDNLFPNL